MGIEKLTIENWQDLAAVAGVIAFLGGVFVAVWKVVTFVREWARRRDEACADAFVRQAIEDVSRVGGTPSELKYPLRTRDDRRAARVLVERGQGRVEGDWLWVTVVSYTPRDLGLSAAWLY